MGMVITRRPGEAVRVGDALVTVVRLKNGKVKLSVDAPPHVPIIAAERGCLRAERESAEKPPS
jgi:carbon storage regulator CsrA